MSIKEIAEKVGVSVSTVSRVLSKPEYKCSSKELR
ncbi:MAG: LacI family DNA-binding transcriptional regulator [Ruminococcus sp.]|nr:LacI family DNA-binding transcriptional regulator [Ruminococcus sp.]